MTYGELVREIAKLVGDMPYSVQMMTYRFTVTSSPEVLYLVTAGNSFGPGSYGCSCATPEQALQEMLHQLPPTKEAGDLS
jgi:hypothetical protein